MPLPAARRAREVTVVRRIAALDWTALEAALWEQGHARSERPLLAPEECAALTRLYEADRTFRSRVVMEAHRFGAGEYKYFAYPLPPLVAALRAALYAALAPIANRWAEALGQTDRYPAELADFLERCSAGGQTRPTPLLLRYEAGGYNCLHQDVYGEIGFPLQALFLLSQPGVDFGGGEFLLVEQRPRAQSIGTALAPLRGELVLFANRQRPVAGRNGFYRGVVRHGLSRVRSGRRLALGVIFHDAR